VKRLLIYRLSKKGQNRDKAPRGKFLITVGERKKEKFETFLPPGLL
jgi:hypothetical protein